MTKRTWAALPCCLILLAVVARYTAVASTPASNLLSFIGAPAPAESLPAAVSVLPEPDSPVMLGIGVTLVGLACLRRR